VRQAKPARLALPGPALPAVLADDGGEFLAEPANRLTIADGFFHCGAQIGEQIGLGRAGDDEGAVVRGAQDVVPVLGRQVELLPEEFELLGERRVEPDLHNRSRIDLFTHGAPLVLPCPQKPREPALNPR